MPTKRTADGAPTDAKQAVPEVAVDGDLNPDHCSFDRATGTATLGFDVIDGTGWRTVVVKFGLMLEDEVEWLQAIVDAARAAVREGAAGAGDSGRPPAPPDGGKAVRKTKPA
jgi:acyl dehydratase